MADIADGDVEEVIAARLARGPRAAHLALWTAVTAAVVGPLAALSAFVAWETWGVVWAPAIAAFAAAVAVTVAARRARYRWWRGRERSRLDALLALADEHPQRRSPVLAAAAILHGGRVAAAVAHRRFDLNDVEWGYLQHLDSGVDYDGAVAALRLAATATAVRLEARVPTGAAVLDGTRLLLDRLGISDEFAAFVVTTSRHAELDDIVGEVADVHSAVAGLGDDALDAFCTLAEDWDSDAWALADAVAALWAARS